MMGGNSQEMAQTTIEERNIKNINRILGQILDGMDVKTRKSILRKGAAVIRKEARQRAPKADDFVFRYKKLGSNKAKKGKGSVVAAYKPGNLAKAIATLNFRKSKNSLFVGARTRNTKKIFLVGEKVSQSDGYYAHFVEFGTIYSAATPFLRPALEAKRNETTKVIEKFTRLKIEELATK